MAKAAVDVGEAVDSEDVDSADPYADTDPVQVYDLDPAAKPALRQKASPQQLDTTAHRGGWEAGWEGERQWRSKVGVGVGVLRR